MKYAPYILVIMSLGYFGYNPQWVSFALICLITAFIAYREVMEGINLQNVSKAQLDALNDRIKLMEERTDVLHSKFVQNTISGRKF